MFGSSDRQKRNLVLEKRRMKIVFENGRWTVTNTDI